MAIGSDTSCSDQIATNPLRQVMVEARRYVLVGMLVVIVDYGIFLVAMSASLNVVASNALAKVASSVIGYWLHRQYTFAEHQHDGVAKQAAAYFFLALFNLALSSVLIQVLTHNLGWWSLAAKIFTDAVVICLAFLVSKFIVYAPARK